METNKKNNYIFKIIITVINILIPLAVLIIGVVILRGNAVLKSTAFMLFNIIKIICLPIMIMGIILIINSKHKKIELIIMSVITIVVYAVNSSVVFNYAIQIVQNISNYGIVELLTSEEAVKETDIVYLENYVQKQALREYLEKNDIIEILRITVLKSEEIDINYKDKKKDVELNITNKQAEKIQELKEDYLKSNYYTFSYEIVENKISIYIERYVTKELEENKEENSRLILSGEKNTNIIKEEDSSVKTDGYFNIENKIVNVDERYWEFDLLHLSILLTYDEETQNYVPVVKDDDTSMYSCIDSYVVTNSQVNIVLRSGAELETRDYTLRINRYDENLQVSDYLPSYYYEYEPYVSESVTNDGKPVLQIDFNRNSYTMKELKNIEIIFGTKYVDITQYEDV